MPDLPDRWPAIQVVMMPRDANPLPGQTMLPDGRQIALYNSIFGGVLLAYIDMAGAIAAQRAIQLRGGNPKASFVTVALNRVEFKKPVLVGDVVRFEATLVRIGRTSVTMRVDVVAERGAETIHVTEAEAVFVGVDLSTPDRKPVVLFPDGSGFGSRDSGFRAEKPETGGGSGPAGSPES